MGIFSNYFISRRSEALIKDYEQKANLFLSGYKTTKGVLFGNAESADLERIRQWYVRLKEKYKHSLKKQVQLAEDWKNYVYYLDEFMSGTYLWAEEKNDELAKEQEIEIRENLVKLEEIENRFASLLGEEYVEELKKIRKVSNKKFQNSSK